MSFFAEDSIFNIIGPWIYNQKNFTINGQRIGQPRRRITQRLETYGNNKFRVFAKSKSFGQGE